jgi:hypothetical protein
MCILAYVLSTMEEFSLIKVGNLLIYLSLSSSEILLFTYNAEVLKHHVSLAISLDLKTLRQTFTELTCRRGSNAIKLDNI